jgi:hypothetical protein
MMMAKTMEYGVRLLGMKFQGLSGNYLIFVFLGLLICKCKQHWLLINILCWLGESLLDLEDSLYQVQVLKSILNIKYWNNERLANLLEKVKHYFKIV